MDNSLLAVRFINHKYIVVGKQYHFVSVKFDDTSRTYDYLCEDLSVGAGDRVIVKGYDGEKAVDVVAASDNYESELGLPIDRYKSVIRRAD